MRKVLIVLAVVLAVLVVLGVVVDRAAAATAERTITDRVSAELPGATDVSTQIHGVPVLTQVARGSLDHVTVTAATAPASGIELQDVAVDLYGVSTSSPRTASDVTAMATVPLTAIQAKLGDAWTVRVDGDALVASSTGLLAVEARTVPGVADGRLTLGLDWVKILGVEVDGSSVPSAVTDRLDALVASVGGLPLGLTLTEAQVTTAGVSLTATGHAVPLG